jgi:hypothetical protein
MRDIERLIGAMNFQIGPVTDREDPSQLRLIQDRLNQVRQARERLSSGTTVPCNSCSRSVDKHPSAPKG